MLFLVTFDVKNAFNSARWKDILGTLTLLAELPLTHIERLSEKPLPALWDTIEPEEYGDYVGGSTGINPRPAPLERFLRQFAKTRHAIRVATGRLFEMLACPFY